jgi:hypothetical protein
MNTADANIAPIPGGDTPDGRECASCHAREHLVVEDEEAEVFFCVECAARTSPSDLPEFYLDLGWGG